MARIQKPKLDPIPLPSQPGLLKGWGLQFEKTLLRWALETVNSIMSPIWDVREQFLDYITQSIVDEVKPILNPILNRIETSENVPDDFKKVAAYLKGTDPLTSSAVLIGLVFAILMMLVTAGMDPIRRLIGQEVDSYVHTARMSPPEAFVALKRGLITPEEYHNQLSDRGWSEELEEVWEKMLAPLVGVGDLGTLFLRGEIGEVEFNSELAKRGYTTEETTKVKVLLKVIPPLPDIIRMSVREAFTPEVVQRFQLHSELPVQMVEWARKQGLSEEWAKAYWAAHWELPSLSMGFEMLHRGEITENDMRLLIRTHDVSPFWRDKLMNISYVPYTRVDVRRMYETGVLPLEEVYRNYRDLGYDHEKATKMTEFTVAYTQGAQRDLTKTDLLNALKIGYFSPEETKEQLININYDSNEADYYIAKVMYDLWQKEISESVKYLKQQFVYGLITETEVYTELGRLNLPATQVNRYIREWSIQLEAKTRTLTATQLAKFRTQEVIGDEDFVREMSGLGYKEQYIVWWLNSIKKGD